MESNADKSEKITLSSNREQPFHPLIELGSQAMVRKNAHKQLCVILEYLFNDIPPERQFLT